MKLKSIVAIVVATCCMAKGVSASLESDVASLKKHTAKLERQVKKLKASSHQPSHQINNERFETVPVTVHTFKSKPGSVTYNPSALLAGKHVLTYIAGMPVVSSPYLGDRPAFDGSSFIVNISSINQDLRLMLQRMILERHLKELGYPTPNLPILALSGKVEAYAYGQKPYLGSSTGDLDLAGAELDVAAALNAWVEGYLSLAFDGSYPGSGLGQRTANSNIYLSKGFLNIGNLERSPIYFTAGQLFVPFGRFSSSMISSPLISTLGRTKARTLILGYKPKPQSGFLAAVYGFRSDTTNASRAAGGLNVSYGFSDLRVHGEVGASLISGINDAGGMQLTGGSAGMFSGFGSSVANEAVDQVPAFDIHANISTSGFSVSAEWLTTTRAFRLMDLSMNGQAAKPQALNLEGGYTFKAFDKPASVALGYGYSKDALALRLPKQRLAAVFNISLWRDTVESIEYRHDIDYAANDFAAGINSTTNTLGTGRNSDTVSAQLGIYF